MAGESEEVDVQVLYSHFEVLYGLCRVQQYGDALFMGGSDDLLCRVDRTQRIGDIVEGHELNTFQQLVQLIEDKLPILVDGYDLERSVLLFADHLPGNDIRMVFHRR